MKHKNLEIMKENGINVPDFIVVKNKEEYAKKAPFFISDKKTYAVRSSFSAEDDTLNSFAGQFKTLLDVKSQDIPAAIDEVLNSAKGISVQAYMNANNIGTEGFCSVIIQEMLFPDYSGVIFTANPLGILNETVIVVGKGLGDNIVEDKVNTTTYYYNKDDNMYSYIQNEMSPLLDSPMLQELNEASGKIENLFGTPMDIEFAIKDDEVFILQSRPITTLQTKAPIILDNSNIVESYPGISLPLTQDYVKAVYSGIFYNCLLRLTEDKKLVKELEQNILHMVDIANWRIYYRISNWYMVLKLLPFSKRLIPVWQEMLGVGNKYVYVDSKSVSIKTKLTILKNFLHYFIKTPAYMDALNEGFEERFKGYKQASHAASTIPELLQVYEDIKSGVLSDWDLTLVNDMYAFIYTALTGKKNKEYISNIKNIESMKPAIALRELIIKAQDAGINSPVYLEQKAQYIENYGDRCFGELKLETKTYRTHPELLDEYVMRHMHGELPVLGMPAEEYYKENFFIKRAKIGIKNREISRLNRSRLYGLSREIFRNVGLILTNEGRLENPDDVFFLHIDEIASSELDLKEIAASRKLIRNFYEEIPAYSRLVFSEKIINRTNRTKTVNNAECASVLHGEPTSLGHLMGEVLVVTEPSFQLDTTNKILVTKSTDPGWVFLIQNAIGIIAEKGSLLSHTAIISRELHKPAIVNVKDATSILKTGDLIELDAESGTITIIERRNS